MDVLSDAQVDERIQALEVVEHRLGLSKDGEALKLAYNTIKHQRQQLAHREAEVAKIDQIYSELSVAHEALTFWLKSTSHTHNEAIGKAKDVVHRIQATAEAHDAKVREQAIRDVLSLTKFPTNNDAGDYVFTKDILALLNKPESEGV